LVSGPVGVGSAKEKKGRAGASGRERLKIVYKKAKGGKWFAISGKSGLCRGIL